jgi:nitroreductase
LVLVEEVPERIFKGIVGGYGKVIGAPSAFVIIGNETRPGAQESAGYLGEAALLEATALGLGTCWIGGFFDPQVVSGLVSLTPGERVLAVSPVGYGQARLRSGEKLLKRMVKSHARKPLEEIAPGFDSAVWPPWAAEGLQLAHLAPSASNRQPWRFEFAPGPVEPSAGIASLGTEAPGSAGAMTVSVDREGRDHGISRRLDCGIAILHFEIGARAAGAPGLWEMLEPPAVARYRVSLGETPS